ncbi:MAG TPA: C40 family peptidase [Vicinamibacterales bacterium]|nr:C40 family peptidase [Vicinamibacterales bacterium]
MARLVLLFIVAAAGAGCATTGAYAPRPFPGAPAPMDASAPASTAVRAGTTAVLATALDLRGTPYRLGGADPTGFDCSGFVQYVLRQHAVDMPRTVVEQFQVGARTREIAPGDLVFFQTEGSKASHVGIAVDGESFVHAPNSRGVVRVERLDSSYWSARFIGAKRVF